MKDNLIHAASKIFFGSSVAGVGLSFGRDLYKKIKEKIVVILILTIVAGGFFLPFISGSKIYRWYPVGKIRWFFFILIPWFCIALLGLTILIAVFSLFYPVQDGISDKAFMIALIAWSGILLVGSLYGLWLRKKRRNIYKVEESNAKFMEDHGITEVDGGKSFTHMGENGTMLRLESIGLDAIVFMVVGGRNKRAYISLDNNGYFTDYSGVISI